jgi:hypothetical protein
MGGRENSSFLEINHASIRGRQRTQKTNTTPVLPFSCLVFQRTAPQWIRPLVARDPAIIVVTRPTAARKITQAYGRNGEFFFS